MLLPSIAMLKYKYFFSKKYTPKQFYQTALGNCYGLQLPKDGLYFRFLIRCLQLGLPASGDIVVIVIALMDALNLDFISNVTLMT